MLPPSDAWQHQNLKLQEALANIKSIEVPPPAYVTTENSETFVNQSVEDYVEDDEEEEEGASQMPISIAIDASIAIEGHNNSVILPDPSPTSTSRGGLQMKGSAPDNTGRVALLTLAVMKALQSSNIVKTSAPHQRPINLSINASIRVKGEKNVVFSGSKPAKKGMPAFVDHDQTRRNQGQPINEPLRNHEATRKRRANSEAPYSPVGKRISTG